MIINRIDDYLIIKEKENSFLLLLLDNISLDRYKEYNIIDFTYNNIKPEVYVYYILDRYNKNYKSIENNILPIEYKERKLIKYSALTIKENYYDINEDVRFCIFYEDKLKLNFNFSLSLINKSFYYVKNILSYISKIIKIIDDNYKEFDYLISLLKFNNYRNSKYKDIGCLFGNKDNFNVYDKGNDLNYKWFMDELITNLSDLLMKKKNFKKSKNFCNNNKYEESCNNLLFNDNSLFFKFNDICYVEVHKNKLYEFLLLYKNNIN